MQALRFLLRQGLRLRGHQESDGNLRQLLQTWARDSNVADWLKSGRFLSHDHVSELITLTGQDVPRRVLGTTNASVIEDILIDLSLPLTLCRGQVQQQCRVSRLVLQLKIRITYVPAALSVHCFAHSLNLCLQDLGRKIVAIHDAMDLVREIVKLINFSPKRKTLFSSKLTENHQAGGITKPLRPTRWTVRAASIRNVIEHYSTMQEVNETTSGLKAAGALAAMKKFSTLYGLRLGYLFFGAAEETSIALQAKDISL